MKKILLSLIAGMLLLSSAFAQSLVIKDKEGNDVSGQTITTYCAPAEGFFALTLDVFNVSDAAKNVMIKKYDVEMVEDSYSNICWVSCYPPFVAVTPEHIEIEAGGFSSNFSGDLTYGDIQGTSTVKYTFYDMDNVADSTSIEVAYIIGTLGIDNKQLAKMSSISNAYPNPAVSTTSIDYKLPAGVQSAQIKVVNLLGNTIQEISLNNSEGKAIVDVSNLSNGIYFYTLLVNNSAVTTRKLVVKR